MPTADIHFPKTHKAISAGTELKLPGAITPRFDFRRRICLLDYFSAGFQAHQRARVPVILWHGRC